MKTESKVVAFLVVILVAAEVYLGKELPLLCRLLIPLLNSMLPGRKASKTSRTDVHAIPRRKGKTRKKDLKTS